MRLHEYQSKQRLAEFGVPVPHGEIAHTPKEAFYIANRQGGHVFIKAQVLAGERARSEGIKQAHTPEEAEYYTSVMLKNNIQGLPIHKVLVETTVNIAEELYIAIVNDRSSGQPVLVATATGGMHVEESAFADPDQVIKAYINPIIGLRSYQVMRIASELNLPRDLWRKFDTLVQAIYRCYVQSDATLVEINPLAITKTQQFMALDAKLIIDDNALFRHADLAAMRDTSTEDETMIRARNAKLSYIRLDGNIGCLVNGAGLAMATMDAIHFYGGKPANFLDIGGGAIAEKIQTATEIILSEPSVAVLLVNIFGGMTRCDEVAQGIITAYRNLKSAVPLIVRLQGTKSNEACEMLNQANLLRICTMNTLSQAVIQAIHEVQNVDFSS
ncbi:MAG: ADP-forming succinate--CoA ligase subunit beta [Chloroflexi bacterium]|nr:MAG: ADP-forming succinate--CoA ligase subunit beta [Chloroflexota bacterium]